MDMDDIYVRNYEYIDSKPYFASWEIDVFMIFATGFGLALMLTKDFISFGIIVALSILFAIFYNKIKNARVKGFFWHIMYLLGLKQPQTLPPSYIRIFAGG